MAEPVKHRSSLQTIRRARIIASLLPLGSVALLFGGAALAGKLDCATALSRFTSPAVVFFTILFLAILLPAYLRIYYVLLLKAKEVFTADERRRYQAEKQRWERYLLGAALGAGVLAVGFAGWARWG